MNSTQLLAAWNRKILEVYSRRTIAALRAVLPLRLALPRLESFLADNVAKEAAKDALVIRRVGQALAVGLTPGEEMVRQLLADGKEVDRAFLARVSDFPIGIVIRYEEIDPLRLQRISRMQQAACLILARSGERGDVRSALRACYPSGEFEHLLLDLMRLYAQETRALSRSLRLPALLVPLRERVAQSLYGVMTDAAAGLANDVTGSVYRPERSTGTPGTRAARIDEPSGEPVLGLEER